MEKNTTYPFRKCPQCFHSRNNPDVELKPNSNAASFTFEELSQFWWGFRKNNTFFDYIRCSNCSQLYCYQYFDETQLNSLYDLMPDNTDGVKHETLARTQSSYINFLYKFRNPSGIYLEIGPDLGQSTEAAVRVGKSRNSPISKAVLVEPNKAVHETLRTINHDIEVSLVTDISELVANSMAGEAVVIHVLDHLLDPSKYLLNIREQLRPGGLILIVVHDERCMLRKILGRRFPPFTLQHPQLFNRSTLRNFLIFNVLKIKKTTNYFPLSHLAATLCRVVGINEKYSKVFPKWVVPLRLGNIMVVAEVVN